MATFKLTMKFTATSALSNPNQALHRTGGWTESWYRNGASVSDILNAFNGTGLAGQIGFALGPTRAALLGLGAAISGVRLQSVLPVGPAQSIGVNLPGTAGNNQDVPQMALLCAAPGLGFNNIRRFTLRGVPDNQVFEGENNFSPSYTGQLNLFFSALNGWNFKGRDLAQPVNKIVTIDATGKITFEAGVTYNALDFVRILKTKDSGGVLRGGRFQIASIGPGPNFVTLTNWTLGATTGGSCRKDAVVYPPVDSPNTAFGRVVTRRVGRPFVAYRGRRSKKR